MNLLNINFISIHPQFIESYLQFGVFKSARDKKLINIKNINLRDYAVDSRGTVDDRPYGGGDGMVLRPEPLAKAVESLKPSTVILTSPQGLHWQQDHAHSFKQRKNESITFIAGRFSGVDERFIEQYVDLEVSIGDFILSGGELASLVICDSIIRLIPKVLGHPDSAKDDSFARNFSGGLEHPVYTRPEVFNKSKVPEVLLSGHHKKILTWQALKRLERTKHKRPDLQT